MIALFGGLMFVSGVAVGIIIAVEIYADDFESRLRRREHTISIMQEQIRELRDELNDYK